jgi:hypothetical protein
MTTVYAQIVLPGLRERRAYGLWSDLALHIIEQPFKRRANATPGPVSLRIAGIDAARTHDKGGAVTVDNSKEAMLRQGM